jgi:hypothetical protein
MRIVHLLDCVNCDISGFHRGEYGDIFWDVAPYSLLEIDRRFRGTYIHNKGGHCHVDGDSKDIWNVLSSYETTQHSIPEDKT